MYDDNANSREARVQRLRWALLLRSWGHIPIPLHAPEASAGFWESLKRDNPSISKADADARARERAKIPMLSGWQRASMPTEAMLRYWILQEGRNYGVLCGEQSSSLCVIDFDNVSAFEAWAYDNFETPSHAGETFSVASGRGVHLYVTVHRENLPAHKTKMAQGAGDILTTGAFVVGPGSIHPTGATYRVRNEFSIRNVESLEELRLPIERKQAATYAPRGDAPLPSSPSIARIAGVVTAFSSAVEGTRNAMLLWSACRCFDEGMSAAEVEETLIPVALSLGLLEREALATIASAEKQERRSPAAHAYRPSRSRLSPRERQQQRRRGR